MAVKFAAIASLRGGRRNGGSTYVQVLYRLNGKQSSTSFEDLASAARFQKLVWLSPGGIGREFTPEITGAPLLGEHPDDVLTELGYDGDTIAPDACQGRR